MPRTLAPGTIVEFVFAPPRWKGERPRSPGPVVGKLAVVIDYAGDDVHEWGGIFNVAMIHTGKQFLQYGDFMEIVSEVP